MSILAIYWQKNFVYYQNPPTANPQIKEPFPELIADPQAPPAVSAKSAVAIDATSGLLLFEKQPNIRLLPASTTKLLTALVALEKCSWDDEITISYLEPEPTSMGLAIGDTVTVRALLSGLLINSGNDAAYALVLACSESGEAFVRDMNLKARELGMKSSHFVNPAGFDDPNAYSTARDLARLGRAAVANPLLAKIVATKSTVVNDVTGNKVYYLQNINKLLGEVEGLEGIKTGQTEGSLEVLITQTTRQNHTLITVVLGSADRFDDSRKLIDWAFANHQWIYPDD